MMHLATGFNPPMAVMEGINLLHLVEGTSNNTSV
jgi:hypothetical protein